MLELYVFNNRLNYVAPEVIAYFIEHYYWIDDVSAVERCLLHMDTSILDFDSIVVLLRENRMFTTLLHVYASGLNSVFTPLEIIFFNNPWKILWLLVDVHHSTFMLLFKYSELIVVVVSTPNLTKTISIDACWVQRFDSKYGHVNIVVKPDENRMICVGVLTLGLCSMIKSVNNDMGQSYGTPWRESNEIMNSRDNSIYRNCISNNVVKINKSKSTTLINT